MSRLGDHLSFLRLARWVAACLLIALGLTLSATSLSGYRVVRGALHTVVRGQGEALLEAALRATRRGAVTDTEALRTLLENETPRGLRCLVLFDLNGGQNANSGVQPLSSVGQCLTPQSAWVDLVTHQRSDELSTIGERMRMVVGPPPPPPSLPPSQPLHGMPPPPGSPWLEQQPSGLASPSGPPWPGPPPQSFWPQPPAERGNGAPSGVTSSRPILIEYAPQMAEQLRSSASRTLFFGGFATLALLIAAAIFWRLSLREERNYATQERQRQLASLGEMAAVLAHELRNPLAALKGHAQLLVEQVPAGSKPHDKALRVVTEAERLEALSEDLLSFVRTTVLEPQNISPSELLSDCAISVNEARIDIKAADAPPRWRLDPVRMRQVLCNLLRNAVEASPEGGHVLASARKEADELVLSVRDFGKGIPEQDLEKIFEPFYTTRARGTGLGLPIARRLVALHGGTITASNAPDGGALFTVRLPAGGRGPG